MCVHLSGFLFLSGVTVWWETHQEKLKHGPMLVSSYIAMHMSFIWHRELIISCVSNRSSVFHGRRAAVQCTACFVQGESLCWSPLLYHGHWRKNISTVSVVQLYLVFVCVSVLTGSWEKGRWCNGSHVLSGISWKTSGTQYNVRSKWCLWCWTPFWCSISRGFTKLLGFSKGQLICKSM